MLEQVPEVTGWLSRITGRPSEVIDWLHGVIGRLTHDWVREILDQLWDHCIALVDLGQQKWLCFSQTNSFLGAC